MSDNADVRNDFLERATIRRILGERFAEQSRQRDERFGRHWSEVEHLGKAARALKAQIERRDRPKDSGDLPYRVAVEAVNRRQWIEQRDVWGERSGWSGGRAGQSDNIGRLRHRQHKRARNWSTKGSVDEDLGCVAN